MNIFDISEIDNMEFYEHTATKLNQVTFDDIMFTSSARREAADDIIARLEKLSGRKFSSSNKNDFANILCKQEIEEGVAVFLTKDIPEGKNSIGKIKLGMEFAELFFGPNRSNKSVWNTKYALGVRFRHFPCSEVSRYSYEDLKREFPGTYNDIYNVIKENVEYKMYVFPKAGDFWRMIKKLCISNQSDITWICQTPSDKGSFVPNRPIGCLYKNEIFIYDPVCKFRPYNTITRKVCFDWEEVA